ncbi:hypothetical protein ASG04_05350 [Curtobacterium sp. Leaf183]|nr:hypothetical protein ASG04_05350 [Curtobacterium sp. Leaf183]
MTREAHPAAVALLTGAVGRVVDPDRLATSLTRCVRDAAPDARDDVDAQDELALAAVRAVLPSTRAWLVAHGATDAQAAASVADVERKRDRYGIRGTGLSWFCAVATGRVVAVGRLQFELGVSLPDGTRAWGVHVPETGPLDPDACDRSFAAAPDVLRRLAPEHTARVWSCRSWTLDPGLPHAIGADANLARFADRFTLEPPGPDDEHEGDESAAKFVFGTDLATARTATPVGRVQRAVADRWSGGGHWTERTGTAPVA